ncbi:MAG: hypothetical protein U1G07_27505 [Verrucomicrobiota bacterium]
MQGLITRLHLLNYFWRRWPSGAPPVMAPPPLSQPASAGGSQPATMARPASDAVLQTATPTSATWFLHFRDPRPPQEIQFLLERALMTLLPPALEEGKLVFRANAKISGTQYSLTLKYEGALPRVHAYSLRAEASWGDQDPQRYEAGRKSAESWFGFWTREFRPCSPPSPGEGSTTRYRSFSEATLEAEAALSSVEAVQQAIVAAMKAGASFATAHKEGGTNIRWLGGRFVRADYGESEERREFRSEAEFLQFLRQFYDWETSRNTYPAKVSDLAAWRLILRLLRKERPPGKPRYPIALVAGVIGFITLALAAWQFGTIRSTGVPIGMAARLPDTIAQVIRTQERYLPKLHRPGGRDSFRVDLLLVSLKDPGKQVMVSLTRQRNDSGALPMTKVLGADGDIVWVQAPELVGVNWKTKRRVAGLKNLQQANPQLHVFLATAHFAFTNQLVAVSPDWAQAYGFTGESLRASPCPPPQRGDWMSQKNAENVTAWLSAGGLLTPADWFGALSADEVASRFRVGSSLSRDFPVSSKDEPRQLYHGKIDPGENRARIAAMERISESTFRGASLLRDATGPPIWRLSNPDSVLMLHRESPSLTAPLALVRMTPDGKALWSASTGIDRLNQVLPDNATVVLIGERPPVPNKVSEPILVLIDTTTGATDTVSLWR